MTPAATVSRLYPRAPEIDQPAAEARRLSSLAEITHALFGSLPLKSGVHAVLDILARHHGVIRGIVTFLQEDGESDEGDSIIGPRSAPEPILSPWALEPLDRDRRFVRLPMTMPMTMHPRTLGTLALELTRESDREDTRVVAFLGVVASILAQAWHMEATRRRLEADNRRLRQDLRERYDFSNIVGASEQVQQMYEHVAQVAGTNTTVLIRGESGTGKELIAHAIHYSSLRAKKPLVTVSCATLPGTLIESELFGHEKGACPGADARKKGRFELAEGGTLFLDEIGDIDPRTQVKLLRVLQDREFERVGGADTLKANVRVLATTSKDLERAIAAGTFREDLYHRLNVFSIVVPPLRERKGDLLLLADHFLEQFSRNHRKIITRMSAPAIDALTRHAWPGNVRELKSVLERAVLACDSQVIQAHHLPPAYQTASRSGPFTPVSLTDATNALERDLIQSALKTTRGNRAKAARLLDTTERIVTYKVRKLGIDYTQFGI
jgi:Nif-specific regulatory protein